MEKRKAYKKVERKLCPHCDQQLSLKTFKAHKRKFFDPSTNTWIQKQILTTSEMQLVSSDADLPPPPLPPLAANEVSISKRGSPSLNVDYTFDTDSLPLDDGDDTSVQGENAEIEVWDDEDDVSPPSANMLQVASSPSVSLSLVRWILFFVHILRFTYGVSDTVTSLLLKFFKSLFRVLGKFNDICSGIAENLPGTLYLMRSERDMLKKHIECYVVCRKCGQVYKECDCIVSSSHLPKTKICSYKKFPDHKQARMRQICGEQLLKSVELSTGRIILYPHVTYCYLSLRQSLQYFLKRPDFSSLCEQWRLNVNTSGELIDIYDGRIWEEFQQYKGRPFLSKPLVFGIAMNVDWFQPYKHSTYSVGAIYMTILKLPRSVRNKRENVILCGLTPGPSEPTDLNPFLRPLVDELLELWDGVEMTIDGQKKTVQCALLCIACDIPAGRKVCGFPSFSAHFACSRCKKFFGGTFGNIDYSGFNRVSWPMRTMSDHSEAAKAVRKAKTLTAVEKIHKDTGYHYSALLNLPYLDASRMLIIDPMHNLFQGTAKRMLKHIWIGHQLISDSDLDEVQTKISKCFVPPDIGRIPFKIKSGFSQLTADELKNWVVYFSILTLNGVLSDDEMECWRLFVLAVRVLCQKRLHQSDAQYADAMLLEFCQKVEIIYGTSEITPNMHLHAHLCECIADYGPSHAFWLFSFERYNGMLGKIQTNNRSVELQFMSRFLEDNDFLTIPTPDDFKDEFSTLFPAKSISTFETSSNGSYVLNNTICFPKHHIKALFSASEVDELRKLYSLIYSIEPHLLEINESFKKYSYVLLYEKTIGAANSRSRSTSTVMVNWNESFFGPNLGSEQYRPVRIDYFAEHTIVLKGEYLTHALFYASWFTYRPNKDEYGKPVTIWDCDTFDLPGIHSIIPVQLIKRRTVSLVHKVHDESVLLVVPCVDF